jgi:hypothetical protein
MIRKLSQKSLIIAIILATALLTSTLFLQTIPAAKASETNGGFNTPGNILITDQFNNRVIEVTQLLTK